VTRETSGQDDACFAAKPSMTAMIAVALGRSKIPLDRLILA
jgi:hypothetical protein